MAIVFHFLLPHPSSFKKFITSPQGFGNYSVPVYRYTEALLIYAEAAAMAAGSPSALALERLNMVKDGLMGMISDLHRLLIIQPE